jgi:hypothetical protein
VAHTREECRDVDSQCAFLPRVRGRLGDVAGLIRVVTTQRAGLHYQAQVKKLGSPLNGTADFRFRLWDAAAGGAQIGPTLVLSNSVLNNGLLTADLNFGSGTFAEMAAGSKSKCVRRRAPARSRCSRRGSPFCRRRTRSLL